MEAEPRSPPGAALAARHPPLPPSLFARVNDDASFSASASSSSALLSSTTGPLGSPTQPLSLASMRFKLEGLVSSLDSINERLLFRRGAGTIGGGAGGLLSPTRGGRSGVAYALTGDGAAPATALRDAITLTGIDRAMERLESRQAARLQLEAAAAARASLGVPPPSAAAAALPAAAPPQGAPALVMLRPLRVNDAAAGSSGAGGEWDACRAATASVNARLEPLQVGPVAAHHALAAAMGAPVEGDAPGAALAAAHRRFLHHPQPPQHGEAGDGAAAAAGWVTATVTLSPDGRVLRWTTVDEGGGGGSALPRNHGRALAELDYVTCGDDGRALTLHFTDGAPAAAASLHLVAADGAQRDDWVAALALAKTLLPAAAPAAGARADG